MLRKWLLYKVEKEKKIKQEFKKALDKLITKLNGKATIILFGSRATGKHMIGSDFDLLVISDQFKNMNIFDRINMLLKDLPPTLKIQVIPLTTEEYRKALKDKSIIICEALEKAKSYTTTQHCSNQTNLKFIKAQSNLITGALIDNQAKTGKLQRN